MPTLFRYDIQTDLEGLYDITEQVQQAIKKSGAVNGLCVVFCPHTTAAITINENADPDVVHDFLLGLQKSFPDQAAFRHGEGNSAAHIKSSVIGCEQTLVLEEGRLLLGTWQGIYFCEFDGPRARKFYVKILPFSTSA